MVIVTGLSGAGKSTAIDALEDMGFYCCDNLPVSLLDEFVKTLENKIHKDGAISVDGRQAGSIDELQKGIENIEKRGHHVDIVFVEATDDIIVRRYSQTRRRHPLSGDDVGAGISRDREILAPLRSEALTIDTSGLNVHELKSIISERFKSGGGDMAVALQSFGFKYGLPRDLNVVFDVRFLPNPYFDENLKSKDGREKVVSDYVLDTKNGQDILNRIIDYIEFTLPLFAKEGKLYSSIGIGCTGGRHRSVAIVEEISKRLGKDWDILTRHRDVDR